MALTKVQCVKTTDGKLFEDEDEADKHQRRLMLSQWYAENHLLSSRGDRVDFEDLVEWVIHHNGPVKEILEVY